MSSEKAGSSQLRLSGFGSLASISSTTPPPARLPSLSLSLSIGTGGAGGEEQLAVSSDNGRNSVRTRKNRASALRSMARKRAYTQELEKEVRRLVDDNLKLKRQREQLQSEIAALIGQQPSNKQSSPHIARLPSLSLSIGTGGAGGEDQLAVSSDDGHKSVRAMKKKNRESALRSRARKRAYVQELEKEVRRLVDDNLKLKTECKQLKSEIAEPIGQQPSNKQSSPHIRTSSTQF